MESLFPSKSVSSFQSLIHGGLRREPSLAWDALVEAIADLPAPELLEDVRKIYHDGLLEQGISDLPQIEREIHRIESPPEKNYTLIADPISEMQWWACFNLEKNSEPKSFDEGFDEPMFAEPVRRIKIGRNDPCPCGSGKKYKKCCIDKL